MIKKNTVCVSFKKHYAEFSFHEIFASALAIFEANLKVKLQKKTQQENVSKTILILRQMLQVWTWFILRVAWIFQTSVIWTITISASLHSQIEVNGIQNAIVLTINCCTSIYLLSIFKIKSQIITHEAGIIYSKIYSVTIMILFSPKHGLIS